MISDNFKKKTEYLLRGEHLLRHVGIVCIVKPCVSDKNPRHTENFLLKLCMLKILHTPIWLQPSPESPV